jgi:hypothetical protein
VPDRLPGGTTKGWRARWSRTKAIYLRSGRGKDVDVLKQAIAGLPYPSKDAAQLLSRVVLHDNRTTGRMYEKSLAAIVMKRVLELSQDMPTLDMIHDREVRHVEHHGATATRRLDLYFPQLNFAVEVKSGRVHLSRDVRRQIDIDNQLVREGQLTGCLWFLVYGASPAVLDHLDASQIELWDIGWTYR